MAFPFRGRFPAAVIRRFTAHDDVRIRTAATRLLASMHLPEDAALVIDLVATRRATIQAIFAEWVAPHPTSLSLAGILGPKAILELARRRRCAGLATPFTPFRAGLLAALSATPVQGPGFNADLSRKQAVGEAALTCVELGDASLVPLMVDAVAAGEAEFNELQTALRHFRPVVRNQRDPIRRHESFTQYACPAGQCRRRGGRTLRRRRGLQRW